MVEDGKCDVEKDGIVTLTIEPGYLLKLSEGKGGGDFQGIKAGPGDDINMFTIFTSMRLADLLHPNPPAVVTPASAYPSESLPKPTTDIDQLKQDVLKWGYGFAKDALSPEQVKILKKAVMEQAAGERKAAADGTMALSFEGPNQRIKSVSLSLLTTTSHVYNTFYDLHEVRICTDENDFQPVP